MLRRQTRLFIPALAAALLLPGCQTGAPAQPAAQLLTAGGTPCPGAETFDVAKINAKMAPRAAETEAHILEYTAITPLPPGAEEAETRLRVRVPPTGMWPQDNRVTIWKDAGGVWQIASKNIGPPSPPPPPPPPPPRDADGNILPGYVPPPPPPPPPPYITSALSAENAATLDAFLADPCFINGPDNLPYSVPLNEIDEYGREEWLCPLDSAYYMAEVKQVGLPARYISHACYMDFAVSKLLTAAAYMSPEIPEADEE